MGFMSSLSPESKEYLEMELLDDYEEVGKQVLQGRLEREKAKAASEKAKSMRQQAMAVRQQKKTIDQLMDDCGIDAATKASKTTEWAKEKLKEFGIEIPVTP